MGDGQASLRATKLSDALQNNERMHHCCVLVLSTHGESAETRREPKRRQAMGDGQASLEQRSCRTLCTTTNGCTIVAYSFSPRTAKAQKCVENPSAQAAYDGRRSGFSRATKLSDALQNNARMQHCCVLVISMHVESAEMRREPKRAG